MDFDEWLGVEVAVGKKSRSLPNRVQEALKKAWEDDVLEKKKSVLQKPPAAQPPENPLTDACTSTHASTTYHPTAYHARPRSALF